MIKFAACFAIFFALVLQPFTYSPFRRTVSAQSGTAITFERTSTGFYWPLGRSSFNAACGTWLGGDGSPGHPGCYISGLYHIGVDMLAINVGDPVYAISRGTVFYISPNDWGTGNVGLFIKHTLDDRTEFLVLYGHIVTDLHVGDIVTGGVQIGTIGSYTPPHLHLGAIQSGTPA